MTPRTIYIPNPDFEDEWFASDDAIELVDGYAEKAKPLAEAMAPERLGILKGDIHTESGLVDGVATGRVNAKDFKSHWHEFGTKNHGPTPFLRPAMETVTGKPVKGPKR